MLPLGDGVERGCNRERVVREQDGERQRSRLRAASAIDREIEGTESGGTQTADRERALLTGEDCRRTEAARRRGGAGEGNGPAEVAAGDRGSRKAVNAPDDILRTLSAQLCRRRGNCQVHRCAADHPGIRVECAGDGDRVVARWGTACRQRGAAAAAQEQGEY